MHLLEWHTYYFRLFGGGLISKTFCFCWSNANSSFSPVLSTCFQQPRTLFGNPDVSLPQFNPCLFGKLEPRFWKHCWQILGIFPTKAGRTKTLPTVTLRVKILRGQTCYIHKKVNTQLPPTFLFNPCAEISEHVNNSIFTCSVRIALF